MVGTSPAKTAVGLESGARPFFTLAQPGETGLPAEQAAEEAGPPNGLLDRRLHDAGRREDDLAVADLARWNLLVPG